MKAAGESVKGLVRWNNEDSFYISKEEDKIKNLYIVADGMGGHNAGEVASKKAIDYFIQFLNENCTAVDGGDIADMLVGALSDCNRRIYEKSQSKEKLEGMGTTFTCAVIEGKRLIVAHIGDSRAYIFGKNGYRQITNDHSYVMEMVKQGKITPEEAEVHPKRNIITRAIGTKDDIAADVFFEELEEGDFILLCSDGLTTMVGNERIAEIIGENNQLENTVECLIGEANKNGGKDNISVVLIRFEVEK